MGGDGKSGGQPECEDGCKCSSWKIKCNITKEDVKMALIEFKDVFLFPLLSGLLFGVGTVAGKRLGEKWFASKPQLAYK